LINHIDKLQTRESNAIQEESRILRDTQEDSDVDYLPGQAYPDLIPQTTNKRKISTIPRGLAEEKQADHILNQAEQFIGQSKRARNTLQCRRVNPLPQLKKQLKMARNVMQLQEAKTILDAT